MKMIASIVEMFVDIVGFFSRLIKQIVPRPYLGKETIEHTM